MKRLKHLVALIVLLAGCEPYIEPQENVKVEPLQVPKRDCMLAICMDVSGSFIDEMFGRDGRGYRFTQMAIDRLFRDRMDADDHVLLTQLSTGQPLLWEGTPRDLKRRFKNAEGLKDFVLQRGGGTSNLYAGVADTLTYIHALPGVKDGETRVCVLVLSDMADNSPSQESDKARMIDALRKMKDVKAGVGFYFVDAGELDRTRQCMIDGGIDPRFIECGIVENPPLPTFAEP